MFLDLSKILFASFVIGPFLTPAEREINLLIVSAGVLCSTITWVIGILFARPKEAM